MFDFELIYKWGCDGSNRQLPYQQRFSTSTNSNDRDLFMFSLVPLQLRCSISSSENKKILWKNPRTSSTRYCRPIKYQYKKETIQSTVQEVEEVNNEIDNIVPIKLKYNDLEIEVRHTLIFSMIDGKF
uniref:Uncharacterized protein n=1 Tax=Sipha flava TaxID=143950 RepID=A0A2S2PUW4_9HEMI